ncbi:Aspartic peptidase domain superfamily [Arabidopsis suecica]|uniref:Aspartic peptidase domain superfamily n=1 Tax=Arabidopsis suecica TaxID=45249 RepID=A0A8T1ZXD2_ARASU|nr:Aspartic peptidase domain superfamily [Arabidopsis suecica]
MLTREKLKFHPSSGTEPNFKHLELTCSGYPSNQLGTALSVSSGTLPASSGTRAHPLWVPEPVLSRYPSPSSLGTRARPRWVSEPVLAGYPSPSSLDTRARPRWVPEPVLAGYPSPSSLGTRARPQWVPEPVLGGYPRPSSLVTRARPRWVPEPVLAGYPSPSSLGTRARPRWVPEPVLAGYPSLYSQGTRARPRWVPEPVLSRYPLGALARVVYHTVILPEPNTPGSLQATREVIIDSFDELSTLFLKQYSVLIDRGTSDADLWSLSEQPNEPLRDFLATFKSTLAQVEGITDVAALSALKKALWYKLEFRKELNLSKPTTIRDALHRASDFVAHEEEMELTAEPEEAEPEWNVHAPRGARFLGSPQLSSRRRPRPRPQARKRLFYLERSQPLGDKQEYCELHKTFGHHTSRCRSLGAILAAKFLAGELGTNITLKDLELEQVQPEKVDTARGLEPRNPEAPKRIRGTPDEEHDGTRQRIHTIMGGSAYCPNTVAAIKAYQRRAEAPRNWLRPFDRPNDVIMFEESETNGLDRPHNDPLLITLASGDHDVSRVLIDTGSTIDVIFHETLRQMNIGMPQVNQTPRPVLGFSGETLMTLGTIQMPVQASGITKIIDFSVTDQPTINNAIMGTPWLNLMRAVASTYHLCLKFPTPNGVKTIWGSQKNSRMCFMAAHKLRNLVTEPKAEVNHKKAKISRSKEKYPEEKKAAEEKNVLEAVLGTLSPPKATDVEVETNTIKILSRVLF